MNKGEVLRAWKRNGGLIIGSDSDQLAINLDRLWLFLEEYEQIRGAEVIEKLAKRDMMPMVVQVLKPKPEVPHVEPQKDLGP